MKTKTVILRDGASWCELRPILDESDTPDRAVILRGTYGAAGDLVTKPSDLGWLEAAEIVTPEKTVLAPEDLYPSLEQPAFIPGTLFQEVEDVRGTWNEALLLTVDHESLAKAALEVLGSTGDSIDLGDVRRRKINRVA